MTEADRERDDREQAEMFGRTYLSCWMLIVRPLCGVRFEDPEVDHARYGAGIVPRLDATAKREVSAGLRAVIMEQGRIAAEGRRRRFRRFSHARMGATS
jgi:hypothetical protein